MNKISFLKIILLFFLVASYLRIKDLQFTEMLADVGYELEAARIINQKKDIPLVGPAIGIDGLFIPPTYLYLISFFYLIFSGSILSISVIYAVMGLLSILFLFLLIYLLTNKNKIISLLFLGVLTFWQYHIHLSRIIWHPYPTFFFTSLSLLLGVLSLKKENIFLLVFSQWLFFLALSIYPSPIYLLPIIYLNSYYFFRKKRLSSLKSFFSSILLLSSLFFIVYLPQFIFEIKNKFPSLHALLEHGPGPVNINFQSIMTHYWRVFGVFSKIIFNSELLFWKILLILFIVFLFFINKIVKSKKNLRDTIIDNNYLFIWVLFVSYFLINLDNPYELHRIDSLGFIFIIFLAKKISQILIYSKGMTKIILFLPIFFFLSLFFVHNVPRSFEEVTKKSFYSYSTNNQLGEMIISKIDEHDLNRQEVMIFYNFGAYQSDGYDWGLYLWTTKWQAETIDHFVNRKFVNENPIVPSYQCTINYGRDRTIDYLKPNYYFLICNDYLFNQECLNKFIISINLNSDLKSNKFSIKETFYLSNDSSKIQIFLIEKSINF